MKQYYKIILLILYSSYGVANDSYMRGIMSYSQIKSVDEGGLLFSMLKGERLPSISSSLAVELDLSYSADFSFDILEIGLYAAYELPILNSSFSLVPRVGINYEQLDLNEITLESGHEKIKGFFLSYGVGLQYVLFENNNLYIDITEKGNSQVISYGIHHDF